MTDLVTIISDERLAEIEAALGEDTFAGITRTFEIKVPELRAILQSLRAQGGVSVKAWETRPQGEEAMEPSEIDVHEGAWAVLVGTNAKPIGWVDTHEMFKGRTYRDRMLPTPPPQVIEFITLQTVPQSNAGQHLTVSVRTADGREAEVIRSWGGLPDISIYHTVTESGIAAALSSLEASPAPVSEETVEASCPGCHGTGDQGGNPSYGVCDDCNGTGKVGQPLPAALAAKGGQ